MEHGKEVILFFGSSFSQVVLVSKDFILLKNAFRCILTWRELMVFYTFKSVNPSFHQTSVRREDLKMGFWIRIITILERVQSMM